MYSTESGMTTEDSDVQLLNAQAPIMFTDEGISTEDREEHP